MASNCGQYETIFTIIIHAQGGENIFEHSSVIANRKRGSASAGGAVTRHKAPKLKTQLDFKI
jgi:hypothetical protein